ncbi:hypothetical protein LI951_03490 [Enterococcus sp. BWT-B8]|uniref:hypothetical protein n=1 Tax=unclassified Enterococcus TaxID=2608891 RepID=UPI001E34DD14|nr:MULTISPECIES: hypothetical protein [unclassified Enterococcus]MCB5951122.1 hypothetical protein [Enterococcus sp. BWT-B8]MCB5955062.1 hypothetical protein [Enterococcus sp. CWB-B31]
MSFLKEILIESFGELQCFVDKNFEECKLVSYHSGLFKLRDLISESENLPSIALKGLDIFGRGLIRIDNNSLETNSFSNDIEKLLKEARIREEVRGHGLTKKKRIKNISMKNLQRKL